jgi:hypothetical protein
VADRADDGDMGHAFFIAYYAIHVKRRCVNRGGAAKTSGAATLDSPKRAMTFASAVMRVKVIAL